MKTYVIAAINFHDNLNKIHRIKANSKEEALLKLAGIFGFEIKSTLSIEEIQQLLFDGDMSVSDPLEIKD